MDGDTKQTSYPHAHQRPSMDELLLAYYIATINVMIAKLIVY